MGKPPSMMPTADSVLHLDVVFGTRMVGPLFMGLGSPRDGPLLDRRSRFLKRKMGSKRSRMVRYGPMDLHSHHGP